MDSSIHNKEQDVFVVGDKNQRVRQRNQHTKKTQDDESKKQELTINNSEFETLKNFVGPSYVGAGIYGFLHGIYLSTKEVTFKNRPKKLIATSMINVVGRQASKFANAGGCLCLLYTLVRKSTNYMFDDDMENCTKTQKQMIYGFITGFIFKSSRGLYPAIFSGTLMSLFCGSVNKSSELGYLPKILSV